MYISHLITASAPRLLAVSIVASTVQLAFLPEVDHIHQEFGAGTTHKAGWVPQFVVACPLSIDSWLTQTHWLLAVMARLEGREEERWLIWWWIWILSPTITGDLKLPSQFCSLLVCIWAATNDNLYFPITEGFFFNSSFRP